MERTNRRTVTCPFLPHHDPHPQQWSPCQTIEIPCDSVTTGFCNYSVPDLRLLKYNTPAKGCSRGNSHVGDRFCLLVIHNNEQESFRDIGGLAMDAAGDVDFLGAPRELMPVNQVLFSDLVVEPTNTFTCSAESKARKTTHLFPGIRTKHRSS